MSRTLTASVLALALTAVLPATSALAQSYTAPAGIPAGTAPGSNSGRNVERSWNAVPTNAYDAMSTGSVGRSLHKDRAVRR